MTGSSRGLGRAIALEFAKKGYNIVVNYRKRESEALETLRQIREFGGDGFVVKADVSDPGQVDSMFKEIRDRYGGVDVLVNNAGWGFLAPVETMEDSLWERHIKVNLNGVFYCTKRALPYMLDNKWGRIINITSIAGIRGVRYLSAYSAAKAGVIGFTKSLAQELKHTGVTVNAIAVGFAKTDMGMSFFKALNLELKRFLEKYTLTGDLVDPVEVARLVVYLASDDAKNITGSVFLIDSGQSLAYDPLDLVQG
ncbi:MAG: 3-oxoacyl-ACP reductase FabG [Desulfurococcales archaeon]|nr:3-oxoacyl-ACP reductase FabG [Desulfurococcales archaeon]